MVKVLPGSGWVRRCLGAPAASRLGWREGPHRALIGPILTAEHQVEESHHEADGGHLLQLQGGTPLCSHPLAVPVSTR